MQSQPSSRSATDPDCRACPRLVAFLDQVRSDFPGYVCRPVPSFGCKDAHLLVVGLAPGMHGANRTGRPFTGDHAGILLYQTLHQYGFASAPVSVSASDDLLLIDCRITNAVRCLPPQNKPDTREIRQCNSFLAAELPRLPAGSAVLALGSIAHQAVLMACGVKRSAAEFAHGAVHTIVPGWQLYDSYHCSRYNTQTRRLTESMFHAVVGRIRQDLNR